MQHQGELNADVRAERGVLKSIPDHKLIFSIRRISTYIWNQCTIEFNVVCARFKVSFVSQTKKIKPYKRKTHKQMFTKSNKKRLEDEKQYFQTTRYLEDDFDSWIQLKFHSSQC